MGSKGNGGDKYNFLPSWSSSSTVPEATAYQAYKDLLSRIQSTANRPYEQYQGQLVQGFTPDQLAAFQGVRNMQNEWQPYVNQAKGLINNSVDMMGKNFGSSLKTYMDPYVDSVVKSTMANARESDSQAMNKLTGNAIMQGGMGGDRLGVQKAELGRQQSLANNEMVSKLYSGAYNNAAGMLQNAANMGMGAASGIAGLGNQAMQSRLTGLNALLQGGNQQQALGQKGLEAQYQLWREKQQFPYQQTQWLANLINATGPNMGQWTAGWQINPVKDESGSQGNRTAGILGSILGGLGSLGSLPFGNIFGFLKADGGRVPELAQGGDAGASGLFGNALGYIPDTQVVPARGLQPAPLSFGSVQGGRGGGGGGDAGGLGAGISGLMKGLGNAFKGAGAAGAATKLPGADMAGAPQKVGDVVAPDAATATEGQKNNPFGDNVPLPPRRPGVNIDTIPGGLTPLGSGFEPFNGRYADGGRVGYAGGGSALSPDQIYQYLISQGASANEAAMLTGAAGAESSYDPTKTHDRGTGYGLFGHRLDRLNAMRQYAGGLQRPGWEQQAAFALDELRHRPEHRLVDTAQDPRELAIAQMHYEMPQGYTRAHPERGHNFDYRQGLIADMMNRYAGQQQPVATSDLGSITDMFGGGDEDYPQMAARGGLVREHFLRGGGSRVDPDQLYGYLVNERGADPKEALLLTGAAGPESGYNYQASHDNNTGYGLWGHRAERLAAMRQRAGEEFPGWQKQADYALDELRHRPEHKMVLSANDPVGLTRAQMYYERPRGFTEDNPEAGDNYGGRLKAMQALMSKKGLGSSYDASKAMAYSAGDKSPAESSSGLAAIAKYLKDDKPAVKEDDGGRLLPPDVAQALMAAGFGMMASRRRDTLGAIGEGALTGLGAYGNAQNSASEREIKQAQLDNYRSEARHRDFESAMKLYGLERQADAVKSLYGVDSGSAPTAGVTGNVPTAADAPGKPVDLTRGPLVEGRSTEQSTNSAAPVSSDAGAGPITSPEIQRLRRERRAAEAANIYAPDAAKPRLESIDKEIAQEYARLKEERDRQSEVEKESRQPALKQSEQVAQKLADEELGLQKQGVLARGNMQKLKVMRSLADKPDFYAGAGADAVLLGKQILAAIGGEKLADNASSTEIFKALSNKLVLDANNGTLGGGVSNADADRITATQPSLLTSTDGNKKLIELSIKLEERKMQVAKFARDYAKKNPSGHLDMGFYDALEEWSKKNPLDPELDAAQQGNQQQQSAQGLPVAPPEWVAGARDAIKGGMSREEAIGRLKAKGFAPPPDL